MAKSRTPPQEPDATDTAVAAARVLGDAAARLARRGMQAHVIFTAMAAHAAGNLARCSGPRVAAEELRMLADLIDGRGAAEGAALALLHPAGRA